MKRLEAFHREELWNLFLQGQTDLYFEYEAELFSQWEIWQKAKNILDIGSGNGAYLNKLSQKFRDKDFLGIEKEQKLISLAPPKVNIQWGNAEEEQSEFPGKFDIVFFRLILQHLKNPRLALQHAYKYLKPEGHVIIVDSYDAARKISRPLPTIDKGFALVKQRGGNREISMEIFAELQNDRGPLKDLYAVAFSNLDTNGAVLSPTIRFETKKEKERLFNHGLMLLNVLHKSHDIPIDFDQGYDEIKAFVEDPDGYNCPGAHFFIMKAK